ncbi:acyl-CoA dehydrogenase family protein [Mycolicibacterium moriokaense]|uniref:Alkylation response protein AidB-like acyl-CoA dehydrogenase n=1 Tax=Mycolicibacterium moriokaense TaxID=39691 RepID=A0A318HHM7_9MYCO|nr:acyl-CoA dehydrogenase family protein [Mycolicibacterium moriokaense]PXX06997.1 alkylation response protein AidB-like acyl-CoA dehydrogenase [Mycolicibacterium moriokaense]
MTGETEDLQENSPESPAEVQFRQEVRAWCVEHIPPDWRAEQTGVDDEEFVRFQKAWFAELHSAGYAVPHWPREWGGGLSVAEQVILYQELAAHDAPRLVLAFVSIHHAASTLLVAGTDEQRRRHLPAILDGEVWVQGFSEPEAGSDLASLRTSARREDDSYIVNGQKLWASGGKHADWCLLLARTDPDAPKRKGISYFLLDMTTPGVEVRPIRNAIGDSHFCEIFLNDVSIPAANLVGAENAGWQVAQSTLGAERGLTMLELAERLGNAGFRRLVQACPVDDPVVADRLAQFEIEITGLRGLCRKMVEENEAGTAGPADASIVKLYYSELLQRLTDFGAEVGGVKAHTELTKPMSSGWESGSWVLDFIGSWEWTIPGGSSEIQRTIIAERGLGLPREPSVV